MNEVHSTEKLEGRYGFPVAFSMVVGIVIGIGIFFKATPVLKAAGMNPTIALTAWVLAGMISIFSGLTAAEVGAAIPETGGMIAWIKKIYGDRIAFIVGWSQGIIYVPAILAVVAYYFSVFFAELCGFEPTAGVLAPVALLAVTSTFMINIYTTRAGGILQTIATAAKLIPLGGITLFGLMSANNSLGILHATPGVVDTTTSPILLLGIAMVPVMFAFDGWIFVGTIAGDIKNVNKNLPRAIILGIGFITFFYVVLNIALLKVFPAAVLAEEGMFGVARVLFGGMGAKIITLGIVVSAYGGLNGFTLISTRVPYAMAIEGNLPKAEFFAKIDSKHNQPINSSYTMYFLSCIYLGLIFMTGNADVFGDIPVALTWLFYCMVFVGLFILRKREPNLARPYRVPLYPVIPILAFLGGASIFIYATIHNPMYMAISLGISAIGLCVYRKKPELKIATD
jgi:APA family basic amino acid/polyamine antiporter